MDNLGGGDEMVFPRVFEIARPECMEEKIPAEGRDEESDQIKSPHIFGVPQVCERPTGKAQLRLTHREEKDGGEEEKVHDLVDGEDDEEIFFVFDQAVFDSVLAKMNGGDGDHENPNERVFQIGQDEQ